MWWVEKNTDTGTQDEETTGADTEVKEDVTIPDVSDPEEDIQAPDSGDGADVVRWSAMTFSAAVVFSLFAMIRKNRRAGMNRTRRKLTAGIWLIAGLVLALAMNTAALWYTSEAVEGNLFQTGTVSLNLNGGESVITEEEFHFEPGMTVVKKFFIENESTMDVYYKVYFENVEGSPAEAMEVTIKHGDSVLYSGSVAGLTKEKAGAAEDILQENETVWLTAEFHLPEEVGNASQKTFLLFDLCADAVQTKNNPDRLFE